MDLAEAFTDFLEEQQYKGNSPETIKFYQGYLQHFMNDMRVDRLDALTERTLRTWLLQHRHLSPNTLRTYDRALRVICRWFHSRGYLSSNPMMNLPRPKAKEREIIVFSEHDVKAMLADTKGRREGLRDRALIILLLDTGIRIGEANGLTLPTIDWQEGLLRVDGKSGYREVPFGPKTKGALKLYIDRERRATSARTKKVFLTQEGDPVSTSTLTRRIIKIATAAEVGATKRGPHTFRHTFAVEFIRAGGDAFTLQRLLGHATLDMTRKYVHLAQSDLRAAHRKFSPTRHML